MPCLPPPGRPGRPRLATLRGRRKLRCLPPNRPREAEAHARRGEHDARHAESLEHLRHPFRFKRLVRMQHDELPEQAERDFKLFAGKTKQYVLISSASAYQKPLTALPITESTPLVNPYWDYSRAKAAASSGPR